MDTETKNVKRLIERTLTKSGWTDAGHGYQGREEKLRLDGFSHERRVVVLRRRLKDGVIAVTKGNSDQLLLGFAEVGPNREMFEYAVLVTSLAKPVGYTPNGFEVRTIAQLYRDRADCAENTRQHHVHPLAAIFPRTQSRRARLGISQGALSLTSLHNDYGTIVDAACAAWNKLTAETDRLTSLTWLPWQPRETTRVKT